MIAPNLAAIPPRLREHPAWVLWKLEHRPGQAKPAKVPYNARTGQRAAADDGSTWADFDTSAAAYQRGGFDGLGVMLHPSYGLVGVDLDGCRDPQTGALQPWALNAVQDLSSYTEASPSGTGLRVFCTGKLPPGRRRRGPVEVYDSGRFLTVTGAALAPAPVAERTQELAAFHAKELAGDAQATPGVDLAALGGCSRLSDAEAMALVQQDAKASALWAGDWATDYPSQSEADLALCSLLAVYCGRDPEQIDRLFRESGLYRPKWERPDYRQRTLSLALSGSLVHPAQVDPREVFGAIPVAASAASLYSPARLLHGSGLGLAAPAPRQWIFLGPGGLPRNVVGVIAGQGGAGKTLLALQLGASIASGSNCLAGAFALEAQGPVLLVLAEDDADEIARRLHRIRQEHGRPDLSRLHILPRGGDPRLVARDRGGNLHPTPGFQQLAGLVAELRPVLVIIDSLSVCAGEAEASNPDGAFVVNLLSTLCEAGDKAAVLALAHVSKSSLSSKGQAGKKPTPAQVVDAALDPTAVRGASSIVNNSRWVLTATLVPSAMRRSLGVGDDASLVGYAVRKTNYSAPLELAFLQNRAGHLRAYEPPAPVAVDFKPAILRILAECGPVGRREFTDDRDQLIRGQLAISREGIRDSVAALIEEIGRASCRERV